MGKHKKPKSPPGTPATRDEQATEQFRQDELAKAKRDQYPIQGDPGPLKPPPPLDEDSPPAA
jgi:hypothetical protein